MSTLDIDRVCDDLSPGGRLSSQLPGYEAREQQVRMARAVARTLESGGLLVVEAGTGTGKSLAYLVPAIHWAKENGERLIVSTRTINLQEQLIRTDLPFLQRHLGIEFSAALVKGRGNYLCLRKAGEIGEQPSLLAEEAATAEIASILRWSRTTADGSLADLGFLPRPESWEAVRVEADDCLRSRCPSYDECFFYRARRAAAASDVLVVNHSLLMADLSLRAELGDDDSVSILPPASRLIVDEAHHLEDVSTDYFGSHTTLLRIERILSRLQSPRVPERGILPALLERLAGVTAAEDRPAAEGAMSWIEERLRPRAPELAAEAARCFGAVLLAVQSEMRRRGGRAPVTDESSLRVIPELRDSDLWRETALRLSELTEPIQAFVGDTVPVLERLQDFSEATAERTRFLGAQLGAHAGRLAAVVADLRSFLADDSDLCRWFAVRAPHDRPPALALCFAPVEIGPRLRDTLFEVFAGIVLTSATLTVEKRFDYFLDRTGLAALPAEAVDRLRLPSPFRFADQALVAVPEDLPEPEQAGYDEALHAAIARTVEASRGGAFVLFTSYGALDRAYGALAERLRGASLSVLRQGEADRHTLLERFRRNRGAVLFATDSFWEGVDVRGEGLRAVVIARLPFRVPTEPIQQARTEAIEARGGNSFAEYGLPQAVIKLRQGFGRLIRSREDTGVVALLDSRLAHRSYGEVFLDSLPPAPVVLGPSGVVFREVEKFFGGGGR